MNFQVDSVSVVRDATGTITGLLAKVSLGNVSTQVPLTATTGTSTVAGALSPAATTAGPTSSILSVHLAPINLDLLGLDLTTSDICLNITAQQGGGLLGSLLYDVNNLLNSGGTLGSARGSLTGS